MKHQNETALRAFSGSDLRAASVGLLNTLGYVSEKTLENKADAFLAGLDKHDRKFRKDKALHLLSHVLQYPHSQSKAQLDNYWPGSIREGKLKLSGRPVPWQAANLGFENQLWAASSIEDDGIPFEEKMTELVITLGEQFAESAKLEEEIRENLSALGFACPAEKKATGKV